ncbi:MAG: type II secretion system protein [Hominimerdicola sp.]
MKKSNKKGFTLVELVVVIAIIGILAAILVPTMMNYVKKAKLKSANSNAKLVYTTVNNQAADLVAEGATSGIASQTPVAISSLNTGSPSALQQAVYDALSDNGSNAGQCCWAVDATTFDVQGAQWQGTAGGHVGQYPDPNTDPDVFGTIGTGFNGVTVQ